jgi:hypothetical protein
MPETVPESPDPLFYFKYSLYLCGMVKDFIQYTEALELKQLGFDEPCFGVYATKDGYVRKSAYDENGDAPTYSQAFRWFREKYNIDVSINTVYSKYNENTSKKYGGVTDNESVFTNVGFHNTYEEAELECLKKLIELVKNK